jgi:hypothetical protein
MRSISFKYLYSLKNLEMDASGAMSFGRSEERGDVEICVEDFSTSTAWVSIGGKTGGGMLSMDKSSLTLLGELTEPIGSIASAAYVLAMAMHLL